jgi:RecJ-like exonuclease
MICPDCKGLGNVGSRHHLKLVTCPRCDGFGSLCDICKDPATADSDPDRCEECQAMDEEGLS